ncbi:MAG: hypothetical protein MAG453_00258 [Calditrichaeota bacterium]|nr:hypothetical protein [Calditrichota bacterium]
MQFAVNRHRPANRPLFAVLVAAALLALVSLAAFAQEGELYAQVRSFLSEDGWNPQPIPGTNVIETGFQGDNGAMFCRAHMLEEKRQVVFYSILPNKTPETRRVETMEFITRANYALGVGNFELDLDDGEVRFKTSIDVEGGTLSPTMLETLVYLNVLTMDRYLPGLNAVMFADTDPRAALREVKDELESGDSGG